MPFTKIVDNLGHTLPVTCAWSPKYFDFETIVVSTYVMPVSFFNKTPEIWKWHWSAEPVEMDRLLLEHCEMYTCLAIHQSTERQVWISLMKNPKEEKNPEPVST